MTRLETFRLKSIWGNYNFDFACSMARGRFGGLISRWDSNSFIKDGIWRDDAFIIVKGHWRNTVGDCYMINIYGPQDSLAKAILWNRIARIKQWHSETKASNHVTKHDSLQLIKSIEEKIEAGYANDDNRDSRIKLRQEVDILDTFESFDLFQKACVKWDIEGDENSNFFHRMIKQKRRAQMIHGIMKEGVWISNPSQIKEEFLNFFKEKFKDHDSNVDFPPFANSFGLCALDRDSLETIVSIYEVKNVVWDCGSSKAPGPNGFSFAFARRSSLSFFILVMEGFHNALFTAVSSGLIRGVKFSFPEVFYLASGLKINIQKSNVYGIGVSDVDVSSMAINSGCASRSFPFTYLGLPIGSNMSLKLSWKVLLDKFQSKLSSWKANLLSIRGRHTIIKAVIYSLGIYYFSIFKVPESVLNSLKRSRAMFFGEEGGFDNNGCIYNGTWARIVGSSNFLHSNNIIPNSFFRFQAGCGTHIRFYKDTWVGDSPFYIRYNRLYRLECEKDSLITERIDHDQWRWNWSRHNLGARNSVDLLDMLFEISYAEINEVEDTCVWSLGTDETFSVKDTRCIIDSKILPSLAPSTVWMKKLLRIHAKRKIPAHEGRATGSNSRSCNLYDKAKNTRKDECCRKCHFSSSGVNEKHH
nr:RNA-directed DNA polymerase, eukaryota, reverse transcriptase zinc-binding domain protein [Tanacetum cinerariifolium]